MVVDAAIKTILWRWFLFHCWQKMRSCADLLSPFLCTVVIIWCWWLLFQHHHQQKEDEKENLWTFAHKTLIFDADVTLDKNGKFRELSLFGVERIVRILLRYPRYHWIPDIIEWNRLFWIKKLCIPNQILFIQVVSHLFAKTNNCTLLNFLIFNLKLFIFIVFHQIWRQHHCVLGEHFCGHPSLLLTGDLYWCTHLLSSPLYCMYHLVFHCIVPHSEFSCNVPLGATFFTEHPFTLCSCDLMWTKSIIHTACMCTHCPTI